MWTSCLFEESVAGGDGDSNVTVHGAKNSAELGVHVRAVAGVAQRRDLGRQVQALNTPQSMFYHLVPGAARDGQQQHVEGGEDADGGEE